MQRFTIIKTTEYRYRDGSLLSPKTRIAICTEWEILIAFYGMSFELRTSDLFVMPLRFLGLLWLLILSSSACGDTEYYRHILFDNSLESDGYYYSAGKASSPSTVELDHGKLPVSKTVFYTPPNALRLKWHSAPDGGWEASIDAINFRNRQISFRGDALYFWCFSEEGIPASDLPLIVLSDATREFSKPLRLETFVQDLPARKWVRVHVVTL